MKVWMMIKILFRPADRPMTGQAEKEYLRIRQDKIEARLHALDVRIANLRREDKDHYAGYG